MKEKLKPYIIMMILISIVVIVAIVIVLNRKYNKEEVIKEYSIVETKENAVIAENQEEKTYYLHKSDKENPQKEECLEVQKVIFSVLNENKIKEIKEKTRTLHNVLEHLLADGTKMLKEPTSPYWSLYIDGKEITEQNSNVRVEFGDDYCFNYVIRELQTVIDTIQNKEAKEDLMQGLELLKEGIDEHNIEKIFEAHEYIHDYDVWVIEYPIANLDAEPVEWRKLYTYFGKVSLFSND